MLSSTSRKRAASGSAANQSSVAARPRRIRCGQGPLLEVGLADPLPRGRRRGSCGRRACSRVCRRRVRRSSRGRPPPRRGCRRRSSTRSLWSTVTLTTAASSRSRCERSTSSRGSPWRPRGSRQLPQVLRAIAHRTRHCLEPRSAGELRLAQRLLVAAEGADREVDDLGQQLRQSIGLAGGDLVEDQDLGLAEGEPGVAVRRRRALSLWSVQRASSAGIVTLR